MQIKINGGGLLTGATIGDYQTDLSGYISKSNDIISSFKTVKSQTCSLNGGVSSYTSNAMNDIDHRLAEEEKKREATITIQNKSNDFLTLAQRVDNEVAKDVNKNKDEFYKTTKFSKPANSLDDRNWLEKAWDWACKKGEEFVDGVKQAWNGFKDTVKKAWNGIKDFYEKHKNLCKILIGVAAIAIATVVTVATGGAALPALLAMTKAALVAGLTSAAIGGSISAVFALASGESLETSLKKAFSAAVDGFCSGFMWGGVFAAATQLLSLFTLPKVPSNLDTARQTGVQKAKQLEIDAIKNNSSIYDWTPEQSAEILRTNSFKGYDGCHILDASRYPRFANDPNNIILLPRWSGHFEIVHGGSWANPSNWEAIIQTMPQFTSQIRHMQVLATYSNIITSGFSSIIPAVGLGTWNAVS